MFYRKYKNFSNDLFRSELENELGDSGEKKPKKLFSMVSAFSERGKSFSPSILTQKFYIKLFFEMKSTFSVSTDVRGFNCSKYH